MHGYARLARKLMNDHGLHDWKIRWSRSKRTHGKCCYAIKTLEFSSFAFAHIGEAEVIDTILHEIAHALTPGAGHGPAWRRKHIEIGGNGKKYVTKEAAATIPLAWTAECRNGHDGGGMHRAPLRVKACGKCARVFKPENVMTWRKNGRVVPVSAMPERYRREVALMRAQYGARLPL